MVERLARGDPDLLRHEVQARQHLGHRVLDLDAAVDLDEVVAARRVDEELERAHVLVARGDHGLDGPLGERRAGGVVDGGAGRLLHDLLVAALHGAVALADVDAVAVPVHDHLDLDVAVVLQPLLEVERVVAEGGTRLRAADRDRLLELARGAHHAHAPAAATRRRLDEHRVADALRLGERVVVVAQHAVGARDRGQAVLGQQLARARLGGEPLEHLGRRPDEGQPVGARHLRERVVLGQEAVAGVDRVAAGDERGGQDVGRGQVAAARLRGPDADRLVGELDGARVAVRLAVGHDRADAQAAAGAQDAQGDLAPVGDEDAAEHQAISAGTAAPSGRPAGAARR